MTGPHTWCRLGDSCTCAPLEMRGCKQAVTRTNIHARTYLPPDDLLPRHPQDNAAPFRRLLTFLGLAR